MKKEASPAETYSYYIDRYGEIEGKINFIQYAYFMIEVIEFPNCLEWCEMINIIRQDEHSKTSNS